MIKHIVFWKLKDKEKDARILKDKLLTLEGSIKEIKSIEVGINSEKASPNNYDISLIIEFESFEKLEIYQKHSEHVKVGSFVKEVTIERSAIDYNM